MSDNMNSVEIPAFDKLLQPLLEVMNRLNAPTDLETIRSEVSKAIGLSQVQLEQPHRLGSKDKRSKFEYNLAWACTYLGRAGYIQRVRQGIWTSTPEGQSVRVLDIDKVKRDVRTYKDGKNGDTVTVPDVQDEIDDPDAVANDKADVHTEIQWLLLKLGQDLMLDVWIARNDRSKVYADQKFSSQPKVLKHLPQRFDEATQKTVELIDVLWLDGQRLVAAFEIENTSSIYSGILRLSDLVSMQPDIDVPLFIVAPDERQHKVLLEINRPTFSKSTRLARRCRYLSYSALRQAVDRADGFAEHLRPSFIQKYAIEVTTAG